MDDPNILEPTESAARGSTPARCSADPTDDVAYQRFVEDMAKDCHCSQPYDRPCAGVLAGGICDDLGNDEQDSPDFGEIQRFEDE